MSNQIKILVLGKSGMLGSMVFHYLSQSLSFKVVGTERSEFAVENFLKDSSKFSEFKNYDYVINCVGIIKPYCRDNDSVGVKNAIKINALFPHQLVEFYQGSRTRIIQIATDCVFSGDKGNYDEDAVHDPIDVYGMTKSLGEVISENFLNIRCSIIGPELKNNLGLLGWFLTQKKDSKLKGFKNHRWNGVTTLQFVELVEKIIKDDKFNDLIKVNHVFHFVPNHTVSKYELLLFFNKIFEKGLEIQQINESLSKDLTLITKYRQLNEIFGTSSIDEALMKLRRYMTISGCFLNIK